MSGKMSEKKKATFSLAPWKVLLPIILRYKFQLVAIIVSNMLLAGIDVLFPLLQSRAVDDFILTGSFDGFGGFLAQYGLLLIAELVLLVVYFKNCMTVEMCSGRDMKDACFVNLQKLSLDYYNVTSAGHSLSRVMSRNTSKLTRLAVELQKNFDIIINDIGMVDTYEY